MTLTTTDIEIKSVEALNDWLHANCHQYASVWLLTWLKKPGAPYVSRWDVLDELLCFGWIDGVRRKVDANRTAQLISPRRHHAWTQSYRARVTRLLEEQRVQPAGLAAIAHAKERGLWESLLDVDQLQLPADLENQLQTDAHLLGWFENQASSYRRNVLRWLAQAKQASTRERRMDQIVQSAKQKRRLKNL